jgi:ribosomal protein S27E
MQQPPAQDDEHKTPSRPLEAWRCPSCGRVLMKLALAPGSIVEIKCHSCKAFAVREAA